MYEEFVKELLKLKTFTSEMNVVLAVSGGVDSIALFHLMRTFNHANLSIAHVNHSLRPEAYSEEAFIRTLAEKHQVPAYYYYWDKEVHPQTGIEEAARKIRYSFFKQVMDETNADVLMTAHHQDDQVETILMKLTRGSTLEQLTGIEAEQPFHQGVLIRPLLPFPKKALYDYAHRHHFQYVEDETNKDLLYTRNRFRNQIIPLLLNENNQLNEHVEQFSSDLSDLLFIAKEPIERAYTDLVRSYANTFEFTLNDYTSLSQPLKRAVLKELLQNIYDGKEHMYKTSYIDIIMGWLKEAEGNSQLDLTGDIVVKKAYNQIVFTTKTKSEPTQQQNKIVLETLNEEVELSKEETLTIAEWTDSKEEPEGANDFFVFHSGAIELPLTIRHRQPGDRMTYEGLTGSKKLKDIFIDAKVPLEERDQTWVVEDATGKIIWLIGYRKMYLLSRLETDKLTYIIKYKINKK